MARKKINAKTLEINVSDRFKVVYNSLLYRAGTQYMELARNTGLFDVVYNTRDIPYMYFREGAILQVLKKGSESIIFSASFGNTTLKLETYTINFKDWVERGHIIKDLSTKKETIKGVKW